MYRASTKKKLFLFAEKKGPVPVSLLVATEMFKRLAQNLQVARHHLPCVIFPSLSSLALWSSHYVLWVISWLSAAHIGFSSHMDWSNNADLINNTADFSSPFSQCGSLSMIPVSDLITFLFWSAFHFPSLFYQHKQRFHVDWFVSASLFKANFGSRRKEAMCGYLGVLKTDDWTQWSSVCTSEGSGSVFSTALNLGPKLGLIPFKLQCTHMVSTQLRKMNMILTFLRQFCFSFSVVLMSEK